MIQQVLYIHNSKTTRNLKRSINLLLVVVVIICILYAANLVLRRVIAENRFREFFSSDQDYDVLFFGSSHMHNTINPLVLWNEYGITSYNFGSGATWIPSSYWIFRNAIKVHKPKIAVLEVFATWNKIQDQDISFLHDVFDIFPISKTKIEAIYDIIDKENRNELLFPFGLYHSRWENMNSKTVSEALAHPDHYITKGSNFLFYIYDNAEKLDIFYTQNDSIELNDGQKYIMNFLETCKTENIIPVLLYAPYDVLITTDPINMVNDDSFLYLDLYINQNNYINYLIDFADRAHLNFHGNYKITRYIAPYLKQIIGDSDTKNTSIKERWNEYYENYRQFLFSEVKKETTIQNILLYLIDNNFGANIMVNSYINNEIINNFIEEYENNNRIQITYDNNITGMNISVYDAIYGDIIIEANEYTY